MSKIEGIASGKQRIHSSQSLRQYVLRVGLAVLLFGSLAQATPILQVQEKGLEKTIAASAVKVQIPVKGTILAAPDALPLLHRASIVSAGDSSSICALDSSCDGSLKVPEPQSLVLVGSGLLSMAGLIRRKLIH